MAYFLPSYFFQIHLYFFLAITSDVIWVSCFVFIQEWALQLFSFILAFCQVQIQTVRVTLGPITYRNNSQISFKLFVIHRYMKNRDLSEKVPSGLLCWTACMVLHWHPKQWEPKLLCRKLGNLQILAPAMTLTNKSKTGFVVNIGLN